jgi:hypothetical protein
LGDLVRGAQLAAQGNDLGDQLRRGSARAVARPGGTIAQAGQPQGAVAAPHLAAVFRLTLNAAAAEFNVSRSIMTFLAKASRLRKVSRAFW